MKHLSKRYARVGLALMVAILLIAAVSGSAAAAGPVYHTVQPGQTLYSIATMYGVSVWSLACANGLYNPNYIYAGQVLTIPYGWNGYCRPAYTPQPVAYHPYPQPAYGPHPAYYCYYRVRWGDTLYSIAWRYGTTYWTLANANGISNPNYIYAGMLLRIPYCN
jgi:LysM repeat protein